MSISDIKLAISIYDILNMYGVHYSSKGMQETILCPCHSENKPSARIYPDVNKVHCYGACSRSYDAIDLVMIKEGLSLPEAVKFLEEKFSIEKLQVGAATKFWQNLDSIKRKNAKREVLGLIFAMGKDVVANLRSMEPAITIPLWLDFDKILQAASQDDLPPDPEPIRAWYRGVRTLQEEKHEEGKDAEDGQMC